MWSYVSISWPGKLVRELMSYSGHSSRAKAVLTTLRTTQTRTGGPSDRPARKVNLVYSCPEIGKVLEPQAINFRSLVCWVASSCLVSRHTGWVIRVTQTSPPIARQEPLNHGKTKQDAVTVLDLPPNVLGLAVFQTRPSIGVP